MKNNKLIEVLNSLSTTEFKKFGDLLNSKFFNNSRRLILLYNFFKKLRNNAIITEIDRYELYKAVYQNEKFNDKNYRKLLSNFNAQLESYLILQEFENSEYIKDNFLLKAFKRRGLSRSFFSESVKLRNEFDSKYDKDQTYYKELVDFETTCFEFFSMSYNYDIELNVEQFMKSIDYNFVLMKLLRLTFFYYDKSITGVEREYDLYFQNEVISFVKKNLKNIKKNHPLIYIEYLYLMTYVDPNSVEYFYELRNFVYSNIDKFNVNILTRVYQNLKNFCFKKLNAGESAFLSELLNIDKFFIENTDIFNITFIPHYQFLDIVNVGMRANQIDWVESFIHKYKDKIVPKFRNNTYCLSLAKVYFERKQYENALEVLNKSEIIDYTSYLITKSNLAKIFYEMGNMEAIYSLLDSMSHYIKRKDIIPKHFKESYLHFVKYLNRLVALNSKMNSFKLSELIDDLKKEDNLAHSRWISLKAEELNSKFKSTPKYLEKI